MCGISNALDGTQNNLIRCNKELPDKCVAYGVTVDDGGASDSDPFNVTEHRDIESDSDDPFISDHTSSASDDESNKD